jgi:hypothetical protein
MGDYPHYSTMFHDVKVTFDVRKYDKYHAPDPGVGGFPHSLQVIWPVQSRHNHFLTRICRYGIVSAISVDFGLWVPCREKAREEG